ncbi:hypothetical protein GCM10010145_20890 [Streptomyces ruber]|uniref:Uncharacterized protein n=2 Tax=Streptomyces TaxID=1883 RepID=A0A918EPW2_9ACTN|nr:hypothetical protein GCM10010145_20890 [Streptomyces ruber]
MSGRAGSEKRVLRNGSPRGSALGIDASGPNGCWSAIALTTVRKAKGSATELSMPAGADTGAPLDDDPFPHVRTPRPTPCFDAIAVRTALPPRGPRAG